MVELEDTYDLGSYIFVMCRFESCWGHWLRKQENPSYLTVFDWLVATNLWESRGSAN